MVVFGRAHLGRERFIGITLRGLILALRGFVFHPESTVDGLTHLAELSIDARRGERRCRREPDASAAS